ncbi:cadherin-like protein 26 [Oncorhynchus kisutch]|uniref:Cadherin 26, tandem duplicate 2 n=1 Tax=Oncorhynchus kisutch TaxID=8019 RepID=A0A8C7DBZ7_ONCKI|nr:cadherin-13 [Oncorhynchus kisutch]
MGTRSTCLLMTLCLGIVSVSSEELLHRQKRIWIVESFKIEESRPGPYPYVLGNVHIEKAFHVSFYLLGQGVDLDPRGKLSINKDTGDILVHGELDYELYQILKLTFEARDTSNNAVDTRLGVEVVILDINDNPPVFQRNTYTIKLNESTSQGDFVTAVVATDKDQSSTNNGTFDLKIVSITPTPPDNLEFFLEQSDLTGIIKFKGCLEYEKSKKYTILVEAKDRGEVVQLSSTCTNIINIEDGNNNLPVFTGQTGAGSIKERDRGDVPILRLQVLDQDSKGTVAWKAKYTIHGDKDQNFRITTDPDTNEGVLFVEKPLDYKDGSQRNLSVSVENEVPYFSCKVKGRPAMGLWDVVTTVSLTGERALLSIRHLTVTVEDINDPPIFTPAIKNVMVEENVEVGWYLETFTAIDLDRNHGYTFKYVKGKDPCDCVAVDTKTGKITTTKILDRESPYVKDNVYQVTVFAIDDGQPPMTGTGTLNIHIKDQNDNLPELEMATMDMCLSDEHTEVNITAYDLDEEPYSGPFYFQLQGDDVKGKWRIDPDNGYTVNLVKENTVYAGHHELLLKVFDLQGQGALHNLSVTVCDCSRVASCRMRRATGSKIGESAVGIVIAAMLLLLGFLLLSLLLTFKRDLKLIPLDEIYGEHLLKSNIEIPGTDCKVPTATILQVDSQVETKAAFQPIKGMSAVQKSASMRAQVRSGYSKYSSSYQEQQQGEFQRGTTLRKSAPTKLRSNGYYEQGSMVSRSMKTRTRYSSWEEDNCLDKSGHLMTQLNQRMYTLQVQGEELGDYAPHPYAEEGDLETDLQLDAISIPETLFDQDTLLYLGPRFNTLASICNTADLSAS